MGRRQPSLWRLLTRLYDVDHVLDEGNVVLLGQPHQIRDRLHADAIGVAGLQPVTGEGDAEFALGRVHHAAMKALAEAAEYQFDPLTSLATQGRFRRGSRLRKCRGSLPWPIALAHRSWHRPGTGGDDSRACPPRRWTCGPPGSPRASALPSAMFKAVVLVEHLAGAPSGLRGLGGDLRCCGWSSYRPQRRSRRRCGRSRPWPHPAPPPPRRSNRRSR